MWLFEDELPEGRFCHTCLQYMPWDCFHMHRDGFHINDRDNRCKTCVNDDLSIRRRLKRENPVPADGRCMTCRNKTKLVLDHDHDDLTFKGYVCQKCNLRGRTSWRIYSK